MNNNLIVSHPPNIRNGETVHCLMFDVYIALIPAVIASVYFFGARALWIIFLCVAGAALTEILIQLFFVVCKGNIRQLFSFRPFFYSLITNEDIKILDGSAGVTGLLLAFCLPPTVPYWIPVVGAVFAISIGKHVFGGLGYNIFNPALAGRAFLLAAWPVVMTKWHEPLTNAVNVDSVTSATALAAMKMQGQETALLDLFFGGVGGCIGETSAFAILLGAAYLLYKGTITWHVPVTMLGSVAVLAFLFDGNPVFHLFSGGLMLGAFFMATDVVTSPVTRWGRIIFGIGAGVLTFVIRKYGGYPEGVCYAILIMNSLTPLIDKISTPKFKHGRIKNPVIEDIIGKG